MTKYYLSCNVSSGCNYSSLEHEFPVCSTQFVVEVFFVSSVLKIESYLILDQALRATQIVPNGSLDD